MKYTLLIIISGLFIVSCTDNTSEQDVKVEETVKTEDPIEIEYTSFGAEITPDGAVDSKELLAKLDVTDSIHVKIKSTVSSVCKKKGCWMTVPVGEDTEMRVKFKDYDFFMPLNCEEKNVIFEGWAYKYVTPVNELQHYAEDAGASKEEIEAITEPETGYEFLADGVLMN